MVLRLSNMDDVMYNRWLMTRDVCCKQRCEKLSSTRGAEPLLLVVEASVHPPRLPQPSGPSQMAILSRALPDAYVRSQSVWGGAWCTQELKPIVT